MSRPLVTRSNFHLILQTGLFGNQINTKKQALNISSSRENCAFLHAPSLRLDNSRNQRARDHSAIEVAGSLKEERRPATQEAGAAFRRAPSPPLEDAAFQVCARVEGGEFAGEPPPGSF